MQHAAILEYNEEAHAHDHYNFFRTMLQGTYDVGLDSMLEKTVLFLEAVSGVPVLLSMLVLLFKRERGPAQLPTDILGLYTEAMALSVGDEATLSMLRRVAFANMGSGGRREFKSADVRAALGANAAELALWQRLCEANAVPLVKILENDALLGSQGEGLYQFKHLSFQEALAVQTLVGEGGGFAMWERASGAGGAAGAPRSATRVVKFVVSATNQNMLRIGGDAIGKELAAWAGGDLDAADYNGDTALIASCEKGHEATARALLEAKANVDAANKEGYTALIASCVSGHEATARALLEAGGNVEAANKNGSTALIRSCGNGHEATARALLEAKANV